MTRNRLGVEGVDALCAALQTNTVCATIKLAGNAATTRAAAPPLLLHTSTAHLTPHTAHLTHRTAHLTLAGNGAAYDSGDAPPLLLRLLSGHACSLTSLDFTSNGLRDHGCAAILRALGEVGTCTCVHAYAHVCADVSKLSGRQPGYDRTHQPWAPCDPRAHQPWAPCDPRAHHPWPPCDPSCSPPLGPM